MIRLVFYLFHVFGNLDTLQDILNQEEWVFKQFDQVAITGRSGQ